MGENITIIVDVVMHNGELLFRSQDILLDQLEAGDFNCCMGGEIVVYRRGMGELDRGFVQRKSTYADHPMFCFMKIFNKTQQRSTILTPDMFMESDSLSLLIPRKNLKIDFKNSYILAIIHDKMSSEFDEIMKIDDPKELESRYIDWNERRKQATSEFIIPDGTVFRRNGKND